MPLLHLLIFDGKLLCVKGQTLAAQDMNDQFEAIAVILATDQPDRKIYIGDLTPVHFAKIMQLELSEA